MSSLGEVGPRLRRARGERTLREVAEQTGISTSTLSRLESGLRRPTLELLLPLSQAYRVPLDELVGAPDVGDPRVRLKPVKRGRVTMIPLSQRTGGLQAVKLLLPPLPVAPPLQTHEGYEWLYVLGAGALGSARRDAVELLAQTDSDTSKPVDLWFNAAAGHDEWVQAVGNNLRDALGVTYRLQGGLPFAESLSATPPSARSDWLT